MIRHIRISAASLLLAVVATSPLLAQDEPTYTGEPENGNNAPCGYTVGCGMFGDGPPPNGSGSSGTGINFIDGIVDWAGGIKDAYEKSQVEKKLKKEEDYQRQQAELEEKIKQDEERARLALEEEGRREERLEELGDVGKAIKDYAKIENNLWEQTHRLFTDNRQFAFSGGGQNADGSVGYQGFYSKGYIAGSYNLFSVEDQELYSGTFAGVSTRSGRATGTYYNPEFNERGVFTGRTSQNLNQLFSGGTRCTSNCDDD